MAQACDKYTKTSLMGNWYEERLAPVQNQRNQDAQKQVRQVEESISIPGDNGSILPLPRVSRQPPWITQDIVPDDGFREFRSIQSTTYDQKNINNMFDLKDCRNIIKSNGQRVMYPECNPNIAQTGGVQNYNMLQTQNLNQVEKTREVHQNITDFGSTFKGHPETHNKLYGVTTYAKSFQNPKGMTIKDILSENQKNKGEIPSGTNERDISNSGMKMTSVLTGEKFRDLPDPKDNTSVQRAWLPAPDPAILIAQKNIKANSQINFSTQNEPFDPLQTYKKNTNQSLPYDIATSLPIGDGVYSLQKKYNNPGEYRHIRTDVTIIRNKPLTKK